MLRVVGIEARTVPDAASRWPCAAARTRHRDIVLRNLNCVDRMVTDLLDVERISAGKPLSLTLAEHDLGAIVRDVATELSAEHPGRIVSRVEGACEAHGMGPCCGARSA
jgi:hypothetical protein